MMTEFIFEGKKVRFVGTWDNPLWVAKDVCKCLGLSNVSMAIERLDEDDCGISIIDTTSTRNGNTKYTKKQKVTLVNESGLYHLIFQSIKPEAKRFKKWVTSVVLPEIRKTGSYNGNRKTLPYGINEKHHHLYRPLEDGKAKWQQRFFKDFYDALYALDNRENEEPYHQHPTYFSKLTIKYVYDEFEATAPREVIRELKILREAHEQEGVKGIKALHQLLSDEGKKILEKTIIEVTAYINVANSEGRTPEEKRTALEYWLQVKRGQKTLPVIQASLNKIASLKTVNKIGEIS